MKHRLIALGIVIVFFAISVLFGFVIGRTFNRTSVSDNSCAEQLNACTQQLASQENLKLASVGVSAAIPEAPGFNRYTSNTGVTFVYPAVSDNVAKGEALSVEETDTNDGAEINVVVPNRDPNIYKLPMVVKSKSKDVSAVEFIAQAFGKKVRLLSYDPALKVRRYMVDYPKTAPVNGNGDNYNGYTGNYYVEFLDQPTKIAEIQLGSDPLLSDDMTIVNSLSMVKK